MGWVVKDPVALRAAAQQMDEVLPTPDRWPFGASVAEDDRWMLRAELAAMVTGMVQSALAGEQPDVVALREATTLQARFLAVGNPLEAAAVGGVLEQLRR